MSEASFASLGPTLLARKGGAKPAMRPQLAPLPQDPVDMASIGEERLEDLGWNDMGQEDDAQAANVVPMIHKAANEDFDEAECLIAKRQPRPASDRVLAKAAANYVEEELIEVSDDEEHSCAALIEKTNPQNARRVKPQALPSRPSRRAAFTLRLDPDRHLKLRLASTMKGVSAQALVTEALDDMLERFSELDALAQRMKPST